MINSVADGIYTFLFNLANSFIDIVFIPVNMQLSSLINQLNLVPYIEILDDVLTDYIAPSVGWFVQLIPPTAWSLILIQFTITLSLYAIVLSTHVIIKVLHICKNLIPFMG